MAGYVLRDASLEELVDTLVSTARGELQCSAQIAGALQRRLADLASQTGGSPELESLTPREWEIAELIHQGLTNKEIAVRLTIEVATVKNHVHRILFKLHARNRAEVAASLRRWGNPWRSRSGFPPHRP